ncbi:MAG: C_GCAxxG_C_C family protein [Nitrospinota bacterium]|nr:MAG: C_GCAxxG_C_C family protein [Nitrospinota bacterium]
MQETLSLGDGQVFKAATALAGGVARHGETCGALTGAIMAIGLVVGRERLEDVAQYNAAMAPAEEAYLRFQKEVGHTCCAEIHRLLYGRTYRLHIPEERRAFHEAGGHSATGCPSVCEKAARIAADIILRLQDRQA